MASLQSLGAGESHPSVEGLGRLFGVLCVCLWCLGVLSSSSRVRFRYGVVGVGCLGSYWVWGLLVTCCSRVVLSVKNSW